MISVRLRLFGFGGKPYGGEDQRLDLPSSATVGTLLAHLAGELELASPACAASVVLAGVDVERLLIIVNGQQIHHLQGLGTLLTEDDVVAIMPPFIGG